MTSNEDLIYEFADAVTYDGDEARVRGTTIELRLNVGTDDHAVALWTVDLAQNALASAVARLREECREATSEEEALSMLAERLEVTISQSPARDGSVVLVGCKFVEVQTEQG